MDANNALEPAVADRLSPASDPRVLPSGARWRVRDASRAMHEHVELPLDEADAGGGPDPAPMPPAPQRPLRDAELWRLARCGQGAALRLDFELRTTLVRQVFRRDFVYVSRQLHALEASRRVQGLDRACLDGALAALLRRIDAVQALLQRIAADLDAAIATHAAAGARVAFAQPARFQATIVSPLARRYLALLIRADETLCRLEMAWLLCLAAPAGRTALVSDCRRALHGFKDMACHERQAVGALVREVNAQRRAGVAMQRDG